MLEITMFFETFTIYTENLSELAIENIKHILSKWALCCKNNNQSIIVRGPFENRYNALHDLALEYYLFIS